LQGAALGLGAFGLAGGATGSVAAAPQSGPTAQEFLEAIAKQDFLDRVTSVSFEVDAVAEQYCIYDSALQNFPIHGDTFGIMSAGVACDVAGEATDFLSNQVDNDSAEEYPFVDGGLPEPGDTLPEIAFDDAVLTIEFTVPAGVTSLNFDYKFMTEEIPQYLGSNFQDFFTATLSGPDDYEELITVLPDGDPLTVDNVAQQDEGNTNAYVNIPGGSSSSNPQPPFPSPNDTKFNAVTQLLTAQNEGSLTGMGFSGETMTLTLRVGDATDSILDTAVFLDNLTFGAPAGEEPGSEVEEVVPYQVDFVVGEPNEVLGEDEMDFYGRQNRLVQYAHGDKDGITELDRWINSLDQSYRDCLTWGDIEVSGKTARVSFSVADGCELTMSLVSYTLPDGEFSFETADEQVLADATTATYGPGDHVLEVELPTRTVSEDADPETLTFGDMFEPN
jgi:hypothetical protein